MANYSEIDVTKLRSSINNLIHGIDFSSTENAIDNLSTYWTSTSKGKFVSELKKQKDTNYKNLKDKLGDYLTISDYIYAWQNLYIKNQSLIVQRDNAYKNITTVNIEYETDEDGNYLYDKWGNKIEKERKTTTNYYWQNKYNEYVNQISENESTMQDYDAKIQRLI